MKMDGRSCTVAEGELLFPGFLPENERTGHPIPYPYSAEPKYNARVALRQGTLFPWLDDHWRRHIGRGDEDC